MPVMRRRYTAVPRTQRVPIVMNGAQMQTFNSFYQNYPRGGCAAVQLGGPGHRRVRVLPVRRDAADLPHHQGRHAEHTAVAGHARTRALASTSTGDVLFSATFEAGNLAEWGDGSEASGGGSFLSGTTSAAASTEQAHSSTRSMKTVINTTAAGTHTVRFNRWAEGQTGLPLYYSAWCYFTAHRVTSAFWTIMQLRSRRFPPNDGINTSIISINADNFSASVMRLRAFYRGSTFGGSNQSLIQSLANLPIGQWVHIEAFLFQSAAAGGLFTLWQDGLKILEVSGIQTRYVNGNQRWSLGQSSTG